MNMEALKIIKEGTEDSVKCAQQHLANERILTIL
jgi:hypothetical protein